MITIGYMPRTLQQSQLVTCCNTLDVARTGVPSITWLTIYQTDTLKKLLWQQKVWFHHVSIAIDSQVVIWICWSTLVPFAQNIYTTYSNSGSWVACTVTSPCEISQRVLWTWSVWDFSQGVSRHGPSWLWHQRNQGFHPSFNYWNKLQISIHHNQRNQWSCW